MPTYCEAREQQYSSLRGSRARVTKNNSLRRAYSLPVIRPTYRSSSDRRHLRQGNELPKRRESIIDHSTKICCEVLVEVKGVSHIIWRQTKPPCLLLHARSITAAFRFGCSTRANKQQQSPLVYQSKPLDGSASFVVHR